MSDLLREAITASGLTPYGFAKLLGHPTPSRVYAWRANRRPLPPIVAQLCKLVIAHPEVAGWLGEG